MIYLGVFPGYFQGFFPKMSFGKFPMGLDFLPMTSSGVLLRIPPGILIFMIGISHAILIEFLQEFFLGSSRYSFRSSSRDSCWNFFLRFFSQLPQDFMSVFFQKFLQHFHMNSFKNSQEIRENCSVN